MDDLLGEDWQQKPSTSSRPPTTSNPSAFASTYSSFRASPQLPISGSSTPAPLSRPSSTVNGTSSKPTSSSGATDSFGNLLTLKSQKSSSGGNISMQERQKQFLEQKRRKQERQAQMWDSLGSGRSTPAVRQPSPAMPQDEAEDDVLAAFHKDAPVDRASYFSPPPVSGGVSGRSTPAQQTQAVNVGSVGPEDDDPFGLSEVGKKSNGHLTAAGLSAPTATDDDILGDLGKPVTPQPPSSRPPPLMREESSDDEPMLGGRNGMSNIPPGPEEDDNAQPRDRALAELVDMGFPPDTARIALSENGGNVQHAVGWLLQQAHEESRQKARGETPSSRQRSPHQRTTSSRSPQRRQRSEEGAAPPWMRDSRPSSAASRQRGEAANGERAPAQVAQEFGTKFLKSAGSLWKASQKQMARTIADLQQDGSNGTGQNVDPSQPKWMRDGTIAPDQLPPRRRPQEPIQQPAQPRVAVEAGLTDEAAALDAPREKPEKPAKPLRPTASRAESSPARGRSPVESLPQQSSSQPKFMQQAPPQQDRRPVSKLSRQDVEEQSAQAYISPARRKKTTPKPEPRPEHEVDLFSSAAPLTNRPAPARKPAAVQPASRPPASRPSPAPTPQPPKPKAPPRIIPAISPNALQTSTAHRKTGGEHFKRGDYASAHESYTAALTPLPLTHPIAIIVLSNHALTALKTGDAKVAVSDADQVLSIIGPGQGAGEVIDLGGVEGRKEMKEFFGKALMRKAEALEHMEKYADAAAVWRQATEAGVGGSVSATGRRRCEKAAAPKPATPAAPQKTHATKSPGNSLDRPTLPSASSQAAVSKLRAANAEASKEEDEKFALSDSVDAKLAAWRGGKADNLRALLQSMDLVLWPEAGWKKVGMSDLVMAGKVKIIYMKAIGKVHPDKIPQNATTEQRMISAAVFSTLNEAWDKFKNENGL
ncbi:auxilin-like clathrin-binding protein required for normal clathrin function [Vermiconidia calcicola]|uniref:Auxilin-like clathrin-binding protein required for normal clathrin function n=1 Tax=Vermiconidia calcicola TaxID=1690605 RepID=A0ACC3N010_9PEZI|nr:auxilin-like clathrin-binding protein required for normal clathrin function [Vermiconidia calcicola]